VAWVVIRTRLAHHASSSASLDAGGVFILVSFLACLALYLFVLLCWQWRLSARARFAVLVCLFVSLVWAFCGLCWYDVVVREGVLARSAMDHALPQAVRSAPSAMEQLTRRTAAAAVSMAALAAGLLGLIAILWRDRRRRAGEGGAEE
jgi:hypothetical protein